MSTSSASMHELLVWIDARPRTYREALDTWHSHCPRLTVWEDAVTDGLIRIVRTDRGSEVHVTERGRALLTAR